MYKRQALLVNLGIYGVAQAQEPTDTLVSHDDTIVVTAAEQNLQAPGVSTITADEIRKNPVARDAVSYTHLSSSIFASFNWSIT